eukprot:8899949-Prorocentrum_lima.AAC.1
MGPVKQEGSSSTFTIGVEGNTGQLDFSMATAPGMKEFLSKLLEENAFITLPELLLCLTKQDNS